MDARTFSEAKQVFDYIDGLYVMLDNIDSLCNVKSITVVDDKGKSFELTTNGPTKENFYNYIRNYVRNELNKSKKLLEQLVPSKASIINSIETAFKVKEERNWDRTYWFFDVHGTILKPNYQKGSICTEFYPYAEAVLQVLSEREDIILGLYTCSYPNEIKEYKKFFELHGIHFQYVNENPEVKNSNYGYFDKKPYINVLFEDKAGFSGETDWVTVHLFLVENQMWPNNKEVNIKKDGNAA